MKFRCRIYPEVGNNNDKISIWLEVKSKILNGNYLYLTYDDWVPTGNNYFNKYHVKTTEKIDVYNKLWHNSQVEFNIEEYDAKVKRVEALMKDTIMSKVKEIIKNEKEKNSKNKQIKDFKLKFKKLKSKRIILNLEVSNE